MIDLFYDGLFHFHPANAVVFFCMLYIFYISGIEMEKQSEYFTAECQSLIMCDLQNVWKRYLSTPFFSLPLKVGAAVPECQRVVL